MIMTIPYRYGIDAIPINRNGNVKHKTETERTPKEKQKEKFETSAFSRSFDREKSPASCRLKCRKGLVRRSGGNAGAFPASARMSERWHD